MSKRSQTKNLKIVQHLSLRGEKEIKFWVRLRLAFKYPQKKMIQGTLILAFRPDRLPGRLSAIAFLAGAFRMAR